MKFIKGLFIFLFVAVLLILGAAFAIPYFFKDEIVAVVKEETNARLNATVDFDDVDISLFRSFPDLSVGLQDFSVVGKEEFEGVTLAAGKSFDLTLDLMSVINSGTQPIELKSIHLQEPEVNILVLKNGKANYDIAPPSEEESSTETGPMQVNLTEYSIEKGKFVYEDKTLPVRVEALGLDHKGQGDFDLTVFDFVTETDIESFTVDFDGIEYLSKAETSLDLNINANTESMKFTLKENNLKVNDLEILSEGFVALPNATDTEMDLKFSAPTNTFKSLFSIIPNAYIADYKDVKADGNFTLNGFVKGIYNANTYPAFRINSSVSNADVKYPDLPLGIKDINLSAEVNSPSSNLDKMKVDISNFALKIGNNPLKGYFKLTTPLSDPNMDTRVDGILDLAELNKAYPIEGMEEMTGRITSDVVLKTKLSTIEREDYAKVDASGAVKVENLVYDAADMPTVKIKNAEADFTPQKVIIPTFSVQTGAKSDLSGSAEFDNILAYFSPEKTMRGKISMESKYFDADEWMTEPEASASEPEPTPTGVPETELFDRYDFDFSAKMDKIKYDVYDLNSLAGSGNFTPNKLSIDNFTMKIGDSDIKANGVVTNVMDYLYEDAVLGGKIKMSSDYFNLNPFMEEDPAAAAAVADKGADVNPEDLEPVLIPENIDMTIDANMQKVIYTDMEISDINGTLVVKNQALNFENVKGKTLGGLLKISGGYGTNDPENPSFDLKTDLEDMDFQKAFNTFNTFDKIAPIGKFIEGNFNTSLAMNGVLGKDMYPKLNTLNIDGFLQTLNGVIAGFKPLNEVGEKLNINALKTIEIKNTKNWLEVKDGKFSVKEFDQKYQDIDMKIGGWHQITNEGMEYKILAKIPRKRLGAINDLAGKGLDWLNAQASQLGINVNAGEFVNVALTITGTMLAPKVNVKLLGTDGEGQSIQDAAKAKVQEEIDKQKEKLEAKAREEAEKAKQRALDEAEKLKEEARKKAEEEARKLKEKAEAEAKKKLEEEAAKAAAEAAKKAEEKLGDKAKEELDKLKDKLPFGKKKGGN